MNLNRSRMLVVFFSHKGQNYLKGKIVDLEKGNTSVVADMLVTLTGADMFEIQSVDEYPYEYKACVSQARAELKANSRPRLIGDVDVSDYGVIFLGYPNWCGTMPMPVWTFLERCNFKGHIILPFCTHEGGGFGNSEQDLKKRCPEADLRNGLPIHGTEAAQALELVEKWVRDNDMIKGEADYDN